MDTFFTVLLFLIPTFFLLVRLRTSPGKLPPGSMGLPIIGQSLSLIWAKRANTAEKWLQQRVQKYGPVSKLSLFGKPTVFIYGQAANKLVFASDSNVITNQTAQSARMILGERNLLELNGEDHKRIRGALVSFLKPESLKQYVWTMDAEIREHLELHWQGKQQIEAMPLMKTLTFNMICILLFGIEKGALRDEFLKQFRAVMRGMLSIPINLPFTYYNSSLRSSARIHEMVKALIHKKRVELEQNVASPRQDLIACLLSIGGEDKNEALTEDEIVHNVMTVMIAGHDTTSVLLTFILRILAIYPDVYAGVLKEQEEIAKSKGKDEPLTWEDLANMKYTWSVALETLRMFPPILGGFRKVLKDVEFGGYLIPKGWQIFWTTCMTHMDGNIFAEPSKFNPKRFENQSSIPLYTFVPFGGGARKCPGYDFARVETLTALHYVVTRFTWKLLSDESFSRDPMPEPAQGLLLQIAPRNKG